MAAGLKLNGSALNTKEPDSAITSRSDPRTENQNCSMEEPDPATEWIHYNSRQPKQI